MPFTDEQFKEFIRAMDTREMLIRIDENTKNFHQSITKRLDDHIASDYSEHGITKNGVQKAHERVDELEKTQERFRGMVIASGMIITAILAGLQLWVAIANHH